MELINYSEGNPRAAIWLANRLFEFHCQNASPGRTIELQTWERVKVDWIANGRKQILGMALQDNIYLFNNQPFYKLQPIRISSSHRLAILRYMVQRPNQVCSPEELNRAAWPNDNDPQSNTKRALDEMVRRLKIELNEQGINPDCIETVRGQGYLFRN